MQKDRANSVQCADRICCFFAMCQMISALHREIFLILCSARRDILAYLRRAELFCNFSAMRKSIVPFPCNAQKDSVAFLQHVILLSCLEKCRGGILLLLCNAQRATVDSLQCAERLICCSFVGDTHRDFLHCTDMFYHFSERRREI